MGMTHKKSSIDTPSHFRLRRFFLIVLTALTLFIPVLVYIFSLESRSDLSELKLSQSSYVTLQKKYIDTTLQNVGSDVFFLADQLTFHLISHTTNSKSLTDDLSQEFVNFSKRKIVYDQIRYLDKSGNEIIRVNYNDGEPSIVPLAQLQNKASRYYFSEAIGLSQNELYVSPLDLNVEQGEVETPFKPMIRIGTPVFDSQGNRRGIILVNYRAKHLLASLHTFHVDKNRANMLLNKDGYWLHYDRQPELEFGFMFEDKKNVKFDMRYPSETEAAIQGSKSLQLHTTEGLFTSETIFPLNSIYEYCEETILTARKTNIQDTVKTYCWKIISHVPQHHLNEISRKHRNNLFTLVALFFCCTCLFAWFVATAQEKNKKIEAKIARLAHFDPLTGLINRNFLYDMIDQTLELAKRQRKFVAFLFIDLDKFKPINDEYGHEAGDKVLIQASNRLKKMVRKSDYVARLGGDEFMIVLQGLEDKHTASIIAEKVVKALKKPIPIGPRECTIGASIGISTFPDDGTTPKDLIRYADDAMYAVKKHGRDGFKIHNS